MPQEQKNRQQYHQCRNRISINHQCRNPHRSIRRHYRFQLYVLSTLPFFNMGYMWSWNINLRRHRLLTILTIYIRVFQCTRSNLGQRFPTYAQEYASFTIAPGEIIAMNMRIYRRTKIYAKAKVSDPDTMQFNQEMK